MSNGERRISSELDRALWKDSHPRGVATVVVSSLCMASLSHIVTAMAPAAEPVQIVRDTFYILFGASSAVYVGQRIIVFAANHLFKRMEKVNEMPERFDKLQEFITDSLDDIRKLIDKQEEIHKERHSGLNRRLELLEKR